MEFTLGKVSVENEIAVVIHDIHCITLCWWDTKVFGDQLALREKRVAAFAQGLAFALVSHLALLQVSCLKNITLHILSERETQAGGRLSCSAVAVCYPDMSITPGCTSPLLGFLFFLLCQSAGRSIAAFCLRFQPWNWPADYLLREGLSTESTPLHRFLNQFAEAKISCHVHHSITCFWVTIIMEGSQRISWSDNK